MEYGLLGEKLGHSFSPQIHRSLVGYDYRLFPTPPEEVEPLLRRRDFRGLNVTIPYKQTVIPLCDEVEPRAAAIGAVNTIVNRNDRLMGYNTDIDGLIYLARRTGVDMAGKKVVILGSGGTSHTAQAAAQALGAREIVVISRRGADNYQNLSRHADAQVLINTTPVGMYPNCGRAAVDLNDFPRLTGVLDVVYNPLRTALILAAQERGIPCSGGLPMLVAQAWRAAELFTGQDIPESRVEAVLGELIAAQRNVVLIGMPGCGKTTVGQALARRLGKEFVDIDEEIVRTAGISIPEIFAQEGEEGFRRRESQIVREAGSRTGCVISTGGGVVTQPQNRDPLRQNGTIIHLLRALSALPSAGRPISQQVSAETLWRQRAPLYASFADVTVDNNGSLEDTLQQIEKELM